jgi:hypothetical protein
VSLRPLDLSNHYLANQCTVTTADVNRTVEFRWIETRSAVEEDPLSKVTTPEIVLRWHFENLVTMIPHSETFTDAALPIRSLVHS